MLDSFRKEIIIGAVTLVVIVLTIAVAFGLGQRGNQTKAIATNTIVAVKPSPTLTIVPTFTPIPTSTATEIPIVYTPTSTPTFTPPPIPTETFTPAPTATETPTLVPGKPGEACKTPVGWVSYNVVTGDTLNTLATRTGLSVYDLQLVNCLSSYTLKESQQIYLPMMPPPPTAESTRAPLPTDPPPPTPTRFPMMPEINGLTPRIGVLGQEMLIFVQGLNFMVDNADFRVELRGSMNNLTAQVLQLGNTRSSTSFDAIVPADLPLGVYDVYVINPGDRADVMERAYTNDKNYTMSTATPTVTATVTPITTVTATRTPTPTSTPIR